MKKKPNGLITIDKVIKLLKSELGLKKLSRPSIYHWIKTRGFPQSIGFGIPRQWRREEILQWTQRQTAVQ